MKTKGYFIKRINRFTCLIKVKGKEEKAYLPNSGRLQEILKEGNQTILIKKEEGLPYRLIAIKDKNIWIGVDSQSVNKFFENLILKNKIPFLKGVKIEDKDKKIDDLKIDFVLKNKNRKILCEVKSSALLINKIAVFPDAPTERGLRHLELLINKKEERVDSMIIFIIQREDAKNFAPNSLTHYEFSKKLYEAILKGVKVYSIYTKFDAKNNSLILKSYEKLNILKLLKNEYHLWRYPEVIIKKFNKIGKDFIIEMGGESCLNCSFEENLFDFIEFAKERNINFKLKEIKSGQYKLKAILRR